MRKDNQNRARLYAAKVPAFPFAGIPLPEYPRPGFARDSYLTLNGLWSFERKKGEELPETYFRKILVPYAVESPLSGIHEKAEIDDYLFYEREVVLPESFGKGKVLLHFDGVDQIADVYLDHKLVMTHVGGFTRFTLEIPKDNPSRFLLTVRVKDVTDSSYHTVGKQRLKPWGCTYSSVSGIYFPVWLESVPEDYVESMKITPDLDGKAVDILLFSSSSGEASVRIGNETFSVSLNTPTRLPLKEVHPWSIEDPYLTPVKITYKEDRVSSYFGMRKIEIAEDVEGNKGVYLNHKRIFLTGLLDQGYYYLGDYTPMDYSDYAKDIQEAKKMGFNCLRKHIKIEEDRYYYEADKKGMLILQDFPSGGDRNTLFAVVYPKFFPMFNHYSMVHNPYRFFRRDNEEGRKEWDRETTEWRKELHNFPSVVLYTIFNEAWGEFDPDLHYIVSKKEDPSRLVDTCSGWVHPESRHTDFYSIHAYDMPFLKRYRKNLPPYFLSEIGGYGFALLDHSFFGKKVYGHYKVDSKEKLKKRIAKLYKGLLPMAKKHRLVGTIYTELSDCEIELNGLLTFDRVEKIDPEFLLGINAKLQKSQE